jgi:hypothetical protein
VGRDNLYQAEETPVSLQTGTQRSPRTWMETAEPGTSVCAGPNSKRKGNKQELQEEEEDYTSFQPSRADAMNQRCPH